MDITRGSLDDISRPASSERCRAGRRVSSVPAQERVRCGPGSPRLLIVLSPETEPGEQKGTLEEELCSAVDGSPGELMSRGAVQDGHISHSDGTVGNSGVCQANGSDESEGSELQKAIRKMKELDEILALTISREKELKKKGKKLHQKLLEELQELKAKRTAVHADEIENTRLFLALESASSNGPGEDEAFAPVFGTQVPDIEFDKEKHWDEGNDALGARTPFLQGSVLQASLLNTSQAFAQTSFLAGQSTQPHISPIYTPSGDNSQTKSADFKKLVQEETTAGPSHGQLGPDRSKRKQDFVRKNIELAREAGSQVLMTEGEKLRLAEILQDLEDDVGSEPTGDEEESSVSAVHGCAGDGYTPEPAELARLRHIDSRLQLLLPVESFLSIRSSNLHHVPVQGPEAGQSSGGTWLPGEKVLQDTWAMRGQQVRLREIEDQLERLGRDENPDCTAGRRTMSGEQLRALLEDCMVALSDRSGHWDSEGVLFSQDGPDDPDSPDLLPVDAPRLSATMLFELLGVTTRGGGTSRE